MTDIRPNRAFKLGACAILAAGLGLTACGGGGTAAPTTSDEEPTNDDRRIEELETQLAEERAEDEAPTTTATPQRIEVEVNDDRDVSDRIEVDVQAVPPRTDTPPPAPASRAQPAPAADLNLIPAGVIEDGWHYGYLIDWEGYEFGFDRVDVNNDGTWSNNNTKVRTLQYSWAGMIPESLPWPIEVHVVGQRVVFVGVLPAITGIADEDLTIGGKGFQQPEDEYLEGPSDAGLGSCDVEGDFHPSNPDGLIVCIDGIWQWQS